MLLRNQLYAGIVSVPEYGVRGKRGDFDPLISEELFYRVQAILSGRVPSTAPRKRAHPDFPLRGFVRCESCGRGLTAAGRGDATAHGSKWRFARRGQSRTSGNARNGPRWARPGTTLRPPAPTVGGALCERSDPHCARQGAHPCHE